MRVDGEYAKELGSLLKVANTKFNNDYGKQCDVTKNIPAISWEAESLAPRRGICSPIYSSIVYNSQRLLWFNCPLIYGVIESSGRYAQCNTKYS